MAKHDVLKQFLKKFWYPGKGKLFVGLGLGAFVRHICAPNPERGQWVI